MTIFYVLHRGVAISRCISREEAARVFSDEIFTGRADRCDLTIITEDEQTGVAIYTTLPREKWAPYDEIFDVHDMPEYNAGPFSVRCKEPGCTWEAVYAFPEEVTRYLLGVFRHLHEAHGILFPKMEHQNHEDHPAL